MGKIAGYILATIGLSLAILMPCYYFFAIMTMQMKESGIFQSSVDLLWQGFYILVFAVVAFVAAALALLVSENV